MPVNPETQITLMVKDKAFSRWQRYQIESDLLTPADAFSFTAPNHRLDQAGQIQCGDFVKVLVDGTLQMIGHVDEVNYSTDTQGSFVEISGRDLFSFLLDCSAPVKTFHQQTLAKLAQTLATSWIERWEPGEALADQLNQVKIEPGESVFEVLQRLIEKEHLWLWMTPEGTGKISRPNYQQAPRYQLFLYTRDNPRCVYNNVLRSSVRHSSADQYSTITVYGTSGNTQEDENRHFIAQAKDETVRIKRPLVISDGNIQSQKQAKVRAEYEVASRRFSSLELFYTVKGHYGTRMLGDGIQEKQLFAIDTLAEIEDDPANQHGVFYLFKRRFYGDEHGQYTDLTFRQKGAWLS